MIPYQAFFRGEFYLIRPLAYIEESLLKQFAREAGLPVMENPCPSVGKTKRAYIKEILKILGKENRNVKENIFKALKNAKLDYLLPK